MAAAAGTVAASTETCAFCSAPGHSYLRHAFPFEAFSGLVLDSPLCVTHLGQAHPMLMTAPAEFLPQLPAESAEQRQQRTTQQHDYDSFMTDATSDGAKWRADPAHTKPAASQCRVCRLSKTKPKAQHSASELHSICTAPNRMSDDAVGRALHSNVQSDKFDSWCAEHVWDAVRLMQHWDPRAEAGKGNL